MRFQPRLTATLTMPLEQSASSKDGAFYFEAFHLKAACEPFLSDVFKDFASGGFSMVQS